MLELKEVSGQKKDFSLKQISFQAEKGFIYGIAGKNGAGKTTLFHYILGDERYSGQIIFNGKEILRDRESYLNEVGFISDENHFFMGMSSDKNAAMLCGFYENWSDTCFRQWLKEFHVPGGVSLSNLSRGEYIKFQVAFAMAHDASLFLLDEATAGMDPVFRKDFFKLLRHLAAEEKVVLMSTHIQEELEHKVDYVGIMDNGTFGGFRENIF